MRMSKVNKRQLEHIIRASGGIIDRNEVIIVGSQAIHASLNENLLPKATTLSMEADILYVSESDEPLYRQIDGAIGEYSMFHDAFGIYAHEVSQKLIVLPSGWKERLVRLQNANTNEITGLCLDVCDLCVAKLVAFRDKDIEYVRALLDEGLISGKELAQKLALVDGHADDVARAERFLSPYLR